MSGIPASEKPSQGRPSIRLNLSTTGTSSNKNKNNNPQPASKRRKYSPVALVPDIASASQLSVLHQQTSLHFVLVEQPTVGSAYSDRFQWHAQGRTTLYVTRNSNSIDDDDDEATKLSATISLALHLRATCVVTDVQVAYCVDPVEATLGPLRTSYFHADPLQHVLIQPAASYVVAAAVDNEDDDDPTKHYRFDADAQCSRGAVGMTTGLRAASIASNLGELRLTLERPQPSSRRKDETMDKSVADERVQQAWKQDLMHASPFRNQQQDPGALVTDLRESLSQRSTERRNTRLNLIAQRLSQAGSRALKITIAYSIPLDGNNSGIHHLAGVHVLSSPRPSPHVYTTTGVVGDHEGPRSWLPCCDSASVDHRSTHELTIQLTAPMSLGLSVVGAGEDFGCTRALLLHQREWDVDRVAAELGHEHASVLQRVWHQSPPTQSKVHVIPLETDIESLSMIQTTVAWTSASWTPIPIRSLGFAVGPFKVVEDPEYFGVKSFVDDNDNDDDDDDDDDQALTVEQKHRAFVVGARRNGEGIRQVYFAPQYERKLIHEFADRKLLPARKILLAPLTERLRDMSEKCDQTVTYSTVGVPHRALALMRDVLALPAYRTSSYTQIWIPDAVHGGITSGALHCCPEVLNNPFLGGAIMDSRLLPPIGSRLPFHAGGRVLQFLQARSAIRGWITAALPLGGSDDVGNGYLYSTVESFLMSLYERGYGAYGEGGAKGGTFFSKRYTGNSGLNSPSLDFFPVQNIEDMDSVIGGVGAVPVEDRHNDQLWRSHTNGTESHTAALDEFSVRQLLTKDTVEALERGTDKDAGVPQPSMGWFGSHLSLTFLSSNATTSSDLGCGAVEMQHPVGGLVYRSLKSDVFRGIVEGRAGVANFVRLVRVAFIAAHLEDVGESELRLASPRDKNSGGDNNSISGGPKPVGDRQQGLSTPFVVCVNELLKKKGLSHNLFTRALQNLSGPLHEHHLLGSLVDVERHAEDPRTGRPLLEPEQFPNSYIRGASLPYTRIGVQVEMSRDSAASQAQATALIVRGVQMQAYAEPTIPEGGIAFGGPVTMRIVENEGQFREYVKDLNVDGSRRDWGATFLHAKPVTTVKAQTAASGAIEGGSAPKESDKTQGSWAAGKVPSLQTSLPTKGFNGDNFHIGGYQAIELIRLTNLTPLLWVRVDPGGLFGGSFSVFQPDACLAECAYHDGDAAAQIDSMRALSERPLRIQSASKVTTVYDVSIAELPVRVLGDCLRGTAAAHSSLPHTPVVRSHAALAIAQWQNNKAPKSKDDVGAENWIGMSLLFQYFRERFCSNGVIMPIKYSRLALKKDDAEAQAAANAIDGNAGATKNDDGYQYFDALVQGDERASLLENSEEIELEEDEEYRVRAQVVTAIASIRANDGQTPLTAIRFLEAVLESENAELVGQLIYPDEELVLEQTLRKLKKESDNNADSASDDEQDVPTLLFASSKLVADSLLALCHVNAYPNVILDPTTGKPLHSSEPHPVNKLIVITRSWLDWELYREKIRDEVLSSTETGISGNCHDIVAPNAIIALVSLAILQQSTSDPSNIPATEVGLAENKTSTKEEASVKFYTNIFDQGSRKNDLTRAACAQAVACLLCAADRFATELANAVGLLGAMEFLLDRITDDQTSPGLRDTLALIMMDASTGKVCSMQRVGVVGGRNDLITSASRFMTGPLGASHGGDNGSAILTTVSPALFPAASAVNDGARRGLRLLSRAGHPRESVNEAVVVRVARFATRLWRTINGEPADALAVKPIRPPAGVCAYHGTLRCTLLALWQWIWPKGCFAVLAVQSWNPESNKARYAELGANQVMRTTDEEKAECSAEEAAYADINHYVATELDRQVWRGELARQAYEMHRASKGSSQDIAKAEQGIGQPLPPIERDAAFRQGGWIASAAQQRRKLALDGGGAVTKLRLTVKNPSDV